MSAVGQTIGSGFITDLSETGTTTALQNAVNYCDNGPPLTNSTSLHPVFGTTVASIDMS